jgi:hypothetical protein
MNCLTKFYLILTILTGLTGLIFVTFCVFWVYRHYGAGSIRRGGAGMSCSVCGLPLRPLSRFACNPCLAATLREKLSTYTGSSSHRAGLAQHAGISSTGKSSDEKIR